MHELWQPSLAALGPRCAAGDAVFQARDRARNQLLRHADMYSLGASEEVTGRALREYARLEEIVISTKVRFPMNDRPNMSGLSRKHIVQGCEASLKRL